jgi:hypothetical protein
MMILLVGDFILGFSLAGKATSGSARTWPNRSRPVSAFFSLLWVLADLTNKHTPKI